jgi:hypothetical protein
MYMGTASDCSVLLIIPAGLSINTVKTGRTVTGFQGLDDASRLFLYRYMATATG